MNTWLHRCRSPKSFSLYAYASRIDYHADCVARAEEFLLRRRLESTLARKPGRPVRIKGVCQVCNTREAFVAGWEGAYPVDGIRQPNWRESFPCPRCGLNNRMRASIHVVSTFGAAWTEVYITEQKTRMFRHIARRYPGAVGSEYCRDGTSPGKSNPEGIRHEDYMALSFPDAAFDAVLSFDVLEHVPEHLPAFRETYRCLRPGGTFFFSAPYDLDAHDHIVRARQDSNGVIEHLLPPEYHGDPMDPHGCLSFRVFGWRVLEDLQCIGFRDVRTLLCWSPYYAVLGACIVFVVCRKPFS